MVAGVLVEVVGALKLKHPALRSRQLQGVLQLSQRTRSWCALVDLLAVALRPSVIFLTFNLYVWVEALRLGSAQHSLIQLNAHLTNYADLNFLVAPELFHLA